ncbi:OmpA family protein [Variovorax sp. RKNM96]|uniref:OmpA family protein n=1 Tax=Variovorax sp. RKNM96 TaxID=2681552 RepID=UPI00197E7454|nr:OmpA family protein [Variovorax sp. RKNM96]QSI29045.1 OmpA family protein [Variovorax sp. RKNM96]
MAHFSSPLSPRTGRAGLRWQHLLACVALLAAATFASAAEPAKDHPLVGRYEGSVLDAFQSNAYDEVGLIRGPIKYGDKTNPDALKVAGKVSLYYYKLPDGRSLLEVQRNYEASLKAKGFQLKFSCVTTDGSCYKKDPDRDSPYTDVSGLANAIDTPEWPQIGRGRQFVSNYFENSGRYVLAQYDGPAGTVYASIALAESTPGKGNFAFVRVVETKAMESDKIVFVDATAMQKGLEQNGRVNLYGIHFDLDKDTIKPESQPTIDEIAKLMRANPQLRVQVVGHTDAQGEEPHNADLSRRRSVSVIAALAKTGVDGRRFTSRGAGSKEPVAPNTSEDGRAKNRRVELMRL